MEKKMIEILKQITQDTFILSDLHLGHKAITKFEPCRLEAMKKAGYNEDQHDNWVIHNWNKVVQKNDLVLYLGDFAFKGVAEFSKRLNGNKILILGNHDGQPKNLKYQDWTVVDGIYYQGEFSHKLQSTPKGIINDPMLSGLVMDIEIKDKNQRILFSHYPVYDSNQYDRKNPRIAPRMNIFEEVFDYYKCDYNFHGHVHSETAEFSKCINTSLEALDFKPQKIKDLF